MGAENSQGEKRPSFLEKAGKVVLYGALAIAVLGLII